MNNILKIIFFISILSCNCLAQDRYTMENTKLIDGIRYNANKEPINGIVYVYYPNGEVLLEAQYKNGKMDGIIRGYRPDRTLFLEIIYKNFKEIKRNIYPKNKPIIAYNYQFLPKVLKSS